jgi:hypothetical protein
MPPVATPQPAHPADTQQFAIVPLPPLGTPCPVGITFYEAITSTAIAIGSIPAITADIRRLAASVSALSRRVDRMERERTPLPHHLPHPLREDAP